MKQLYLTIPGKPLAKKRPIFAHRGKFVATYNSQRTEEGKFIAQVLHHIDGHELFLGPLAVEVDFFLSRPKGHYGTGKNAGKFYAENQPKTEITISEIGGC